MQGKSVIAVEDDKFCQETLKLFLTALKVDFTLAANGEEAVKAFKKTPANLVLMDLQMPVMDGYKAAKAIRDFEASAGKGKAKIIGLSGGFFWDLGFNQFFNWKFFDVYFY